MKLPQRPFQHNLEDMSKRFFLKHLPVNWTMDEPSNDYGVDLLVYIFDGTNASPYQFSVQLKSSAVSSAGQNELVPLKVSTYNYLRGQLHVAIIVIYIEQHNEAYWLRLIDIPEPDQDKNTFTVKIPKTNKLSEMDWENFDNYIRKIVDLKLTVADILYARKS